MSAAEKSVFGWCCMLDGMAMIELLAYTIRTVRGGITAVMPGDECE